MPYIDDDEDDMAHNPRKNVMRRFRIKELSAVDFPAQEGALVTIMKRRQPPQEERMSEFNEAVAEIRKRDNCSQTTAMETARRQHPRLFEAYQQAAAASSRPVAKAKPGDDARVEFLDAVEDLVAKRRLSRTAAMEHVRKSRPSLFARAYT